MARKFVMEYGDRSSDVWKVLWCAVTMCGITLRKIAEKKEGQERYTGT